ncbi:MAG: hypothetical protein HYV78_01360 [Candidatus Wildermuthbacteria bacterium]|nr:hypothetical protein [Candidatus Wildermuthbacteria bacterium]
MNTKKEEQDMRAFSGMFFVFDGIDGSGKATQTNLLAQRFRDEGYATRKFSFPQYGQPSAALVEAYLRGDFGPANKINPYAASICYAFDRYAAAPQIRAHLEKDGVSIADRYVSANAGHQGGKLPTQQELRQFLQWLWDMEFTKFQIPKPTLTIILEITPEVSFRLNQKKSAEKQGQRAYLGGKITDQHENLRHLQDAFRVFRMLPELFPKEFIRVSCLENGSLRSPEKIHEEIWNLISALAQHL